MSGLRKVPCKCSCWMIRNEEQNQPKATIVASSPAISLYHHGGSRESARCTEGKKPQRGFCRMVWYMYVCYVSFVQKAGLLCYLHFHGCHTWVFILSCLVNTLFVLCTARTLPRLFISPGRTHTPYIPVHTGERERRPRGGCTNRASKPSEPSQAEKHAERRETSFEGNGHPIVPIPSHPIIGHCSFIFSSFHHVSRSSRFFLEDQGLP